MANEVHELAVRIHPEGTKETKEELNDVGDSFEETADRSEEASRDLNRFSRKFTGALAVAGAIMGGIAAKFLSMVPAVQDAFIGVGSVIDGLIIQFEEEFGPAIRDIGDEFFELGQDVREADGFFEALNVAASGTADIVGDIASDLARISGRTTATIVLDIVESTTGGDPRERLQLSPQERRQRFADAIRGAIGQTARGSAVQLAESFTRGFAEEFGMEDSPFFETLDAMQELGQEPGMEGTGMFDRGTTPAGTSRGSNDMVRQQERTNSILRQFVNRMTRDQREETTVAIEGKSPSVDDDLTANPT